MSSMVDISQQLQMGKAKVVKEMVQAALSEGIDPKTILDEGLLSGMAIIGKKFKNNEVFVPEVLVAARAMNMGIEVLKPYLAQAGVKEIATAVIGTVKGDLHDIGKNLVKMMLESKGFKVVDLGVDVSAERFIVAAIENQAELVCCSALLTTTMDQMKSIVEEAETRGVRDKIKIMIGGAPVTQAFCDAIGADCYMPDAASAADAAAKLVS